MYQKFDMPRGATLLHRSGFNTFNIRGASGKEFPGLLALLQDFYVAPGKLLRQFRSSRAWRNFGRAKINIHLLAA